mmetsp:Transcript_18464/g.23970  ORF Transcript_18464/g.23970 Transcript_18464/m.23970 type:complete len:229 (+) Transcript_18464:3292-3978(+)
MARAGLSTLCTKVTPAILCIISGTSFGLVMATKMFAVMCSMSLFPITSRAAVIAAVAAVFTCFLVSHMQAVTSGTISGRASLNCFGAVSLNTAMQSNAAERVCHFFSTGSSAKMAGRSAFMAKGLIFLQIAMEVSPAKARTSFDLEPLCWMAAGRHSLKNTSETRLPDSAMAFTVVRPARASASSVLAALAMRTSIGKDLTPSAAIFSTTDAAPSMVRFEKASSKDIV